MKNQQNFGTVSCVSIVLHHLLKELPIEVISSNVVHILQLIEFNKDNSFDQHLNYRLLGFRLYESKCPVDIVNAVLDKVMQVITQYESLDEFLSVVDAYADLILQNHMERRKQEYGGLRKLDSGVWLLKGEVRLLESCALRLAENGSQEARRKGKRNVLSNRRGEKKTRHHMR
ncbi:hypothetical protein TSUD_21840 [Trifolium subterraneum]|uniref:NPH3 domain-containing protein n=1 Tax=Trifolium subterraneum TaxID=3900 RepID=A0A2Z6NGQ9_TRISU|nr:hypothetical protein TSUD_21840 [Trifolium subterraneum]